MQIVGEPYEVDKKMYVKVIGPCKRCGGSGHYSMNAMGDTTCYRCNGSGKESMEVRWYTDSQRASMDKAAEKRAAAKAIQIAERKEANRVRFAARNAHGFGKEGYITLVVGEYDTIQAWRELLPQHTILYNTIFGWHVPSEKTANLCDIPEGLKFIRVNWSDVRVDDDPEDLSMKDNETVSAYVNSLIYGTSKSEYQGQKDEWLEHDVTIKNNITLDSQFGISHMHIMIDTDGNEYVWTTASKSLEEGSTVHMRMKVKDHKEYKGVKQTIVYYCKIK